VYFTPHFVPRACRRGFAAFPLLTDCLTANRPDRRNVWAKTDMAAEDGETQLTREEGENDRRGRWNTHDGDWISIRELYTFSQIARHVQIYGALLSHRRLRVFCAGPKLSSKSQLEKFGAEPPGKLCPTTFKSLLPCHISFSFISIIDSTPRLGLKLSSKAHPYTRGTANESCSSASRRTTCLVIDLYYAQHQL
jgi:hypothetical protein